MMMMIAFITLKGSLVPHVRATARKSKRASRSSLNRERKIKFSNTANRTWGDIL